MTSTKIVEKIAAYLSACDCCRKLSEKYGAENVHTLYAIGRRDDAAAELSPELVAALNAELERQ